MNSRASTTKIGLYLDPASFLRWHEWLASALSDIPHHQVVFVSAATSHPLPRSCLLALELERMIYRLHGSHAIDRVDVPDWIAQGPADDKAGLDVVIDLVGQGQHVPRCRRVLTPLFNSVPGEIGAIGALLGDEPLRVAVHDSASMSGPLTARPAMSDPKVFVRALDGILSRAAELIIKALDEPPGGLACNDNSAPLRAASLHIPVFPAEMTRVAQALTAKIVKRIGEIATGAESWAIAYRFDGGMPLVGTRRATFQVLPDDGRRFYADPFPFRHNGQSFIFVEDFPFATQRGCISVALIDENGMATPPRIVIEEPYHLSFPFVFEHDGEIWMIPESADAGRIDLYRADVFPYRWTREGSLIEGIAAYDATLLRHDGRFWLLASLGFLQSTSWDNLSIFHADHLLGPWTPHAQNPVLLDAMCCRPAGAPFMRNGALLRPVQDCSRIYGGAVMMNRVDELSAHGFRQTPVARMTCNTAGCHTYNRHMELEVLDIFAPTRRLTQVTATYAPIPAPMERSRMPLRRPAHASGLQPPLPQQ